MDNRHPVNCECNYCQEINRRVLIHEELVEALEDALRLIPKTDEQDDTISLTRIYQTLQKAKDGIPC